jgi:siderophore synthetase component
MLARAGANAQKPNQAGSSLLNIAINQASFVNRGLLGYRDALGDALGLPSADFWTTMTHRLVRWQGQSPANTYQLFDLINDPFENTNLAYSNTVLRGQLESAMQTAINA